MSPAKGLITRLLLHGAENATSTAELVRLTGLGSARHVQKVIEAERKAGAVILSSTSGGYYLPDDGSKGLNEIRGFVQQMDSRSRNIQLATDSAREALKGSDDNGR